MDGNSVLPTFTCRINGNCQVRVLKDLGCQSNFITEQVATSQNLKVIHENVVFKIKGFNSDKEYITKIVEVEIGIETKIHAIQAICIPEININLKLPRLPIVTRTFMEKGYVFADQNLEGIQCISDIDMLLGTKSAYCLKHSEIAFSPEVNSIIADTEIGIMLLGDIDIMIKDLPYLPSLVDTAPICSLAVQKDPEIDVCMTYGNSVSVCEQECLESPKNFAVLESDRVIDVKVPNELLVQFAVLDENGKLNEAELKKATAEALEIESQFFTHYDVNKHEDTVTGLVEYILNNTTRNSEGCLIMPVLWNPKVCHLLGSNKELAIAILKSNLNKLKKNDNDLNLMDASFKEQEG